MKEIPLTPQTRPILGCWGWAACKKVVSGTATGYLSWSFQNTGAAAPGAPSPFSSRYDGPSSAVAYGCLRVTFTPARSGSRFIQCPAVNSVSPCFPILVIIELRCEMWAGEGSSDQPNLLCFSGWVWLCLWVMMGQRTGGGDRRGVWQEVGE